MKIVLILALVIVLLVGGIVLYFYNYHVFKTLTICVSEEETNTTILCSDNEFCQEYFMNNLTYFGDNIKDYEKSPPFVNELMNVTILEATYCDNTCFVKQIYGDPIDKDFEGECNPGDKKITKDLHGKEGIEFLRYVKNRITPGS